MPSLGVEVKKRDRTGPFSTPSLSTRWQLRGVVKTWKRRNTLWMRIIRWLGIEETRGLWSAWYRKVTWLIKRITFFFFWAKRLPKDYLIVSYFSLSPPRPPLTWVLLDQGHLLPSGIGSKISGSPRKEIEERKLYSKNKQTKKKFRLVLILDN